MSNRKPKIVTKIRPPIQRNFKESWPKLSAAINQVYRRNASTLSFEELYRSAYNMVLYKCGEKLYDSVRDQLREYLNGVIDKDIAVAIDGLVSGSGSKALHNQQQILLKAIIQVWEHHVNCLSMTRDFLMYLDRVYIESSKRPHVFDMGLDLFRECIADSTKYSVKKTLVQSLLDQIEAERKGQIVNKDIIKQCLQMLQQLKSSPREQNTLFDSAFEQEFLVNTRNFYQTESKEWIFSGISANQYLVKVQDRINEEEERCRLYFSSSTVSQVLAILEMEFLANYSDKIVSLNATGLDKMIQEQKYAEIARMYSLLARIQPTGHDSMRSQISQYILKNAREIHQEAGVLLGVKFKVQAASAIQWVEKFLSLKADIDSVLSSSLFNDKSFLNSINGAFEVVFNENESNAEFLCIFIDEKLRKGLKGKTENEVESVLDSSITLFKFMRNKDVFEGFYKHHLAKRLLLGKSSSEDLERNLLVKLKVECGNQFTSKLEGMFNDVRVSNDFYKEFKQTSTTPVDFQAQVLTTTLWPISLYNGDCVYPLDMQTSMQAFEQFYCKKHSGRKLTWLPTMGTAEIKVQFAKGKKELTLSTFPAIILICCFQENSDEWLTFEQIQQSTRIGDKDLRGALLSLSTPKYPILIKNPPSKDIDTLHSFKFNVQFTCPLHKIKIPSVSVVAKASSSHQDQDSAEAIATLEIISQDRKHQIEACIVRIMKTRKTLEHNQLVSLVIDQLNNRFQPDPKMIKGRIESLIDREYLERETSDMKIFRYLA